jgi:hypothetical protein
MDTMEIVKAIKFLRPTAEFSFEPNDYSTIKWDILEGEAPSWKEIQDAHNEIKLAEEQAQIAAETKRVAALAKLKAFGLEFDDLKALGILA